MIGVRELSKRFGSREVLRGLDLDVPPGVVTLLVGANGAGKTTLLRAITGLCTPDRGSVHIAGIDIVRDRIAALASLAFLPQSPRFHPRLTTQQVARYYGRIRDRTTRDVADELERWGLSEHLHATTDQLSGGLRQRLAIAIFALARAPVLVLDEPGLSLDPDWRIRLQAHLSAQAQRGCTVLVATHLLGEWEGKTGACVLLADGRVSGALPPERLRESFPTPERVAAS
jgi:ABC-type multidrug transport system ATPase subunit